MVRIHTSIEIAAIPERVRNAFLDFPKLPEWSTFFKSIEALGNKKPTELGKGDKVKVDFGDMKFDAPVVENTPRVFKWAGGYTMIFLGAHSFIFEPSKISPGSTTFTNMEDFTGVFSLVMKMSYGKKTEANFNRFNGDLKRRVEGGQSTEVAPASI